MNNTGVLETFRPQFHFTPKSNWMNDPNGMVYYAGEYHLFYQYHPFGTTWGPMHWGHAVSKDLMSWEHLTIALAPDENGAIFSGSAVVDWNDTTGFFHGGSGLVAIFTHADLYPNSDRPRQRQSLAYSTDQGRTWIKYEGNPVLTEESITDFRDPKVFWHEKTNKWIMILAAGDHVRFYTSLNLKDWHFASEFGTESGSHAGVWECPDLFELPVDGDKFNSKWVMLVSIGNDPAYAEGSRTQYFIGDFNGITFTNENGDDTVLWLDHGRDNYAGVTWSDIPPEDGRRLFIGWMSNWRYANETPTEAWRSSMTLPRELTLCETSAGVRLFQTPVAEVETIRQEKHYWDCLTIAPEENILSDVMGDKLEIIAEMELHSSREFGFKIRKSEIEETVIGYNAVEETLFIDRVKSGVSYFNEDFPCRHGFSLKAKNNRVRLHLFVDSASVEVFVNDGELVLTDQIFPDPTSKGLELYTKDGKVKLISLTMFHLNFNHS
ncbi:glycoside hydrolase family 32 protein [Heyndrickxia acidicola]|uniref:Glycoside hydrolase family 32 protein n=1 Tax=Heyndrickxia acidicola TaxID=209389 RepID=A0ABU6MMR4_9BACI|nr:glycoside hydrolase family 32 protein [Heyndrickxia acidicola]MED1205973.1 glycoside hydrolase family 32 protein [Heyndrickxia acidicola]